MKEVPEFESAGLSRWSLFTGGGWSQNVQLPGKPPDTFEHTLLTVLPGFFDAYGTRLLAGRDFRPFEGKQLPVRTAIVNEAFARRHFGGANPVGRIFLLIGADKPPVFEIVGMVEDARYNTLRSAAPPMAYFPASSNDKGGMTLAVRSDLDAAGVGAILRREIPRAHPGLQLDEITTLEREIEDTLLRERLVAKLSVFFGAVALLLTSVGLFGLLSYFVVRRTRDIGIRMALGARAGVVIGLVLRQVTAFFVTGLALGAGGAAIVGRWMESLLYGVRPLDAFAYASAIAVLALVSLAACLAPAIRAARVNPVLALRTD
jgi:predicted permease